MSINQTFTFTCDLCGKKKSQGHNFVPSSWAKVSMEIHPRQGYSLITKHDHHWCDDCVEAWEQMRTARRKVQRESEGP